VAGVVDKLQEILTAVARLADLEKRHSGATKELREDLRRLEERVGEVDRHLSVLESRFNGLARAAATEARAAAQSAAVLAVGEQIAQIRERLALLERSNEAPPSSPRLPDQG
jgi:chromosome segregation ATPase